MNRREPVGLKGPDHDGVPRTREYRKPLLPRALGWTLAACLGAFLLTACSAAPELDEEAAKALQTQVAATKELAAQQNFPAAVAELQELDRQVATAAENGQMSQERKTRIDVSINKVRADLEAAMARAEPQPVPSTPAAEPPAGNDGKDQEEGATKEAEKQQEEKKKEAEKEEDNDKGNR